MAKQSSASASNRGTTRTVARPSTRKTAQQSQPNVRWSIPLAKMNFFVILAGVAVIIIGYLLMSTSIYSGDPANNDGVWDNTNAISIAPFLLTIGYLVIIPLGLFYRFKTGDQEDSSRAA